MQLYARALEANFSILSYVSTILGHAHSTTETINVTFKIGNDIIFSGNIPVHSTTANVEDLAAEEIIRWSSETPLAGTLHVSGSVGDGDLFFALISELKVVLVFINFEN